MAHSIKDFSILLTPFTYMELIRETEDPEKLKTSYKKESTVAAFFNLLRKQQQERDPQRSLFISTFSTMFTDPPEQLTSDFIGKKKKFLKMRHKDPHTIVISSVIHMESLVNLARKSGLPEDLAAIEKFTKFLEAMDKESQNQEGLTLPINYVSAIKEASLFAKENPIQVSKEVNWADFIDDSDLDESIDDSTSDNETGDESSIEIEGDNFDTDKLEEEPPEEKKNVNWDDFCENQEQNLDSSDDLLEDFDSNGSNSPTPVEHPAEFSTTENVTNEKLNEEILISDDDDEFHPQNVEFVTSPELNSCAAKTNPKVQNENYTLDQEQKEKVKNNLPRQAAFAEKAQELCELHNLVVEVPHDDTSEIEKEVEGASDPNCQNKESEGKPCKEGAKLNVINKKAKYAYHRLKKKTTEKLVNIINKNSYSTLVTDCRNDLFNLLFNESLMSIEEETLIKIRSTTIRSLNHLKVTMKYWGSKEYHKNFDSKNDYGTKIIIIPKTGEVKLESRKYMKRHLNPEHKEAYEVYDCTGGKMCSNPECIFLKANKNDPLVGDIKNTSHFSAISNVPNCIYCESQGIENTLEDVLCSNALYIVKNETETEIYSLRNHSCQYTYRIDVPNEFSSDFKRHQVGYHQATNSTIRSMLLDENDHSAEVLYSKSSNFVAGAKHGTTLKNRIVKPQSLKIRVDALVPKLRERDPNFVLKYSENVKVLSSTRSLKWMYEGNSDDYFLDVCFSRLASSENLCVVALYTYDPISRTVLKLATGYIHTENANDISIFIITINSAIGLMYNQKTYKLLPKNMFVDYADSNKEAFILAGYTENEVKSMLVGCESHFGDFISRNQGFFHDGFQRATFKQMAYDWRHSATMTLADGRFTELRDFIVKNSTNKKTVLSALDWWQSRPYLTLQMYSSISPFASNLAEVGHSPFKKKVIVDEAMIQDCVREIDQWARKIAHSKGSTVASGSGPTILQVKHRYERQLEHKVQEIGTSLDVLDDMESEDVLEPGPSGSQSNTNATRIKPKIKRGGIKRKRLKFSSIFNENYNRVKKMKVSVTQVLEDTDETKTVSLRVSQSIGLYSGGETVRVTMSEYPSCTCKACEKQKGVGGKSINNTLQVCSPQIWTRLTLFKMQKTDLNIVQVSYTKQELAEIFQKWETPIINDNRTEEELKKIFLEKEKHFKRPIEYYIDKIDTRMVGRRKRCLSEIHGPGGLRLDTLNNLYIRVENSLTVPRGRNEAFQINLYLCATKVCARERLPFRCNIYPDRVPDTLKLTENNNLSDSDFHKIYAEGFEVDGLV